MVKKRQAPLGRGTPIPVIHFDDRRAKRLGVEVVGLRQLIAREVNHDLSRPQRPAFHHVFLATEGSGTHTVDFVRHRLRPGTLLHVAPGQVQQFGLERSLDALLLVFEPDFARRAPTLSLGLRTLPPPRRTTVRALFEAITRECAAPQGALPDRRLIAALVDALLRAIEGAEPEAVARSNDPLLTRFAIALEASFARAHEVLAYAAVLDCSPRTLSRACERAFGRSAKRLIDERVALEAKRMLAHDDRAAAEISRALGFAEPTQFGKFFKRVVGEAPAHFRARFR
jgi:AraC-like DNA-binding protein